jgi:MFS superfamily sulfate permease-like transporter
MLSVDRLLGLAGMGSTIANISMLKRFLSGIAVVIALTAISSTMAGMLLIAGFYALYLTLIHHGLDPSLAALTVGGGALTIVIVLAIWAVLRWYELRDMPRLLYTEAPLIHRATKLADAFINGLLAERTRRR